MGGNFREKLEEAARIKFCGFKFRGARGLQMTHVNFELGIRGVNFSFMRQDGTLQCQVLHEGLVSQARSNQPQYGLFSGY